MGAPTRKDEVIEYPENYEEMITKLREREQEQMKRALQKKNAETSDELQDIAGKSITKRQLRTSSEHKSLRDSTVIVDPKSEDVNKLREALSRETDELARHILTNIPPSQLSSLQKKLKGRITLGREAFLSNHDASDESEEKDLF